MKTLLHHLSNILLTASDLLYEISDRVHQASK